jgi:hypothetical protein
MISTGLSTSPVPSRYVLRLSCFFAHRVVCDALPPTHRSSSYVSSHVGTEICTRQLLGNNNCLTALYVLISHPYPRSEIVSESVYR